MKLLKWLNEKKMSDFERLKDNKVVLTDEERAEVHKRKAVWHPNGRDKPTSPETKHANVKHYDGPNVSYTLTGWKATGTVINTGEIAASNVTLTFTIRDTNYQFVEERSGKTSPNYLAVNAKGTYDIRGTYDYELYWTCSITSDV